MRKLASIQRIAALAPIPEADAIEVATVLGWNVVVKKGEFELGQLVVYCEIDSLMPECEAFLFLKPRGMRIRTIRLKGQVSQGICFPTSVLPAGFAITEDADCTEALGVTKYDPPMPAQLAGIAKGNFPSFIPKTDETRVQVLQKALDVLQGVPCIVTEKIDGSSATFYINQQTFGVCSRNLELEYNAENSFWKVAAQLDIENKLRSLSKNIALQGELYGEGIQGNKANIKGQSVLFFNAYDIDTSQHLGAIELQNLLATLALPMVPVLETDYLLQNDISTLVQKATIKSVLNSKAWAEGIVIRPKIVTQEMIRASQKFGNGRISFKAINPEFLLKYGD